MKPMFRAICELVQTGSMLFSATCGTMLRVCEAPPRAGRASGAAMAAAAPSRRLRRCIPVFPHDLRRSLARWRGLLHLLAHLEIDRVEQARREVAWHTLGDEHHARAVIDRRPAIKKFWRRE